MSSLRERIEWVAALIPDLSVREARYTVDTVDLDDELLAIFSDEITRLCSELQAGKAARNLAEIRTTAHSFKGMGGTMGRPELSVVGEEIELLAASEQEDRCFAVIDQLLDWQRMLS